MTGRGLPLSAMSQATAWPDNSISLTGRPSPAAALVRPCRWPRPRSRPLVPRPGGTAGPGITRRVAVPAFPAAGAAWHPARWVSRCRRCRWRRRARRAVPPARAPSRWPAETPLRSRSNASSGPHPCWSMMMPLACSITGMVSCLAASRANSESCKISRRDRPRRIGAGPRRRSESLSRRRAPHPLGRTRRSRGLDSTHAGFYCLKGTAGGSPRRSRTREPARSEW
jgi:hypothetical protein